MKKIFFWVLATASFLSLAQQDIRGFERALEDCKEGVYERAWLYKGCTLHDLEGLANRLSAACLAQSYRDQFVNDNDQPIDLELFLGSDEQSARAAWCILLPLEQLSYDDIQLLRTVIHADESVMELIHLVPGQLLSVLMCFAAFDSCNLFNQTAHHYGRECKRANGLQWFPLIMAQAYGETFWASEQCARIILGDQVDIAWALPVALAQFVCSPRSTGSIDHLSIVSELLDDTRRDHDRRRFAYHHSCK